MDNHPVGWPLLYETPLGMFCLYRKVMRVGLTFVVCCRDPFVVIAKRVAHKKFIL